MGVLNSFLPGGGDSMQMLSHLLESVTYYLSFKQTVHLGICKNKLLLLYPSHLTFRSFVSAFVCSLPV